jgi:predicted nucleotide-binding protein
LNNSDQPPNRCCGELEADKDGSYFYKESAGRVLGALRAANSIAARQPGPSGGPAATESSAGIVGTVFIVHGHDETLLNQVARFLEALELTPTVLFEEAARGRTIIEKLDEHRGVGFAVVLLTPDDVGRGEKETELRPRARQNVILELGFFLGSLGRANVGVLYEESVELPSDYRGVEYIKVDAVARELKSAGVPLDMNKAI